MVEKQDKDINGWIETDGGVEWDIDGVVERDFYEPSFSKLPLTADLVDIKGELTAGTIARVTAGSYIDTGGVLQIADGDTANASHASVDDEAGSSDCHGSFVDGQAWFWDDNSILDGYAGTANLLIVDDGSGNKAYGYLGEVGAGEVATPLANNITAITKADPGVVSSVAHGLVVGDLVYFDSLTEMTELNTKYKNVTAVGGADVFSINDTSGYVAAETTGGACAHEVTEPNANAVKIYKDYALGTEGWNALDDGIDYNAGSTWDFDVYVNTMLTTGGGAEARFETLGLLSEGEGMNFALYSEDISNAVWTKINVKASYGSVTDPEGNTSTTSGLIADATADEQRYVRQQSSIFADNAVYTFSAFVKAGTMSWVQLFFICKNGITYPNVYFNLSGAGSIGTESNVEDAGIESLSGGWYRIWMSADVKSGGTTPEIRTMAAEGDGDNSMSANEDDLVIYTWGVQIEATPYATSYIPTTSIPVVRTTDSHSWTMSAAFKNLMGNIADSEFTMVVEWVPKFGYGDTSAGESVIALSESLEPALFNQKETGLFKADDGPSASTVDPDYVERNTLRLCPTSIC